MAQWIDKSYLRERLKLWSDTFNNHAVPVLCTIRFFVTEKRLCVIFMLLKYIQTTVHEDTSDAYTFEINLDRCDYDSSEEVIKRLDEIVAMNFTEIISGFGDHTL